METQRTEFNKQVLKVGENGKEATPIGGFPNYGNVNGQYMILRGSVPGPTKRLVMMRSPARVRLPLEEAPKMEYLSLETKKADCWGGSCFSASLLSAAGYDDASVVLGYLVSTLDSRIKVPHAWIEFTLNWQGARQYPFLCGGEESSK